MSGEKLPKGYKQTEVGVIPVDWEVKRLKHISPSQSVGLVINPSSYFDAAGSVPMLVGSHVSENCIDWGSANRISDISNKSLPASRLTAGDIVTVRVGDPGVTAVVPPELDGCNCASMMIVRQHSSFVSSWLCYLMNSRLGRSQIENVQYGTAQKQFNIKDAVDFLYPVPSFEEQEAIARTLSDTDALIESLEQLITKKRHIKQGAMQELLAGKRRLSKFGEGKDYKQSEVGLIPEDWEIVNLNLVSSEAMQNGVFYKPSHKGFGVKLINVGDLYGRTPIDTEVLELFDASTNEKERFKVEDGDLFFTRSSVVPSGIAHCNVYSSNRKEVIVFDSHVVRMRPNQKKVTPSYLFRFCISPIARKYLVAHAKTGSMTTIDQGVLGKCPILLPNLVEQEAIAHTLSDMDTEIATLETKLTKTRQLKQGMMRELLTGRIRLI